MRPYLIASAVIAILSSLAHANHTPNPDEPKLRSRVFVSELAVLQIQDSSGFILHSGLMRPGRALDLGLSPREVHIISQRPEVTVLEATGYR